LSVFFLKRVKGKKNLSKFSDFCFIISENYNTKKKPFDISKGFFILNEIIY